MAHPKVAVLRPVGAGQSNDDYIFAGELFVPRGLLQLAEAHTVAYYLEEFRRQKDVLGRDILPVLRIAVAQLKYLDTKTEYSNPPNYSLDVSPDKKQEKPRKVYKAVNEDVVELVHTHQYNFYLEIPGRLLTDTGLLPDGYYKMKFTVTKAILKATPPHKERHEFFFGSINIYGLDYDLFLEGGDNTEEIVAILGSPKPPTSGTSTVRIELRPGQKRSPNKKRRSKKSKKERKRDDEKAQSKDADVYTVMTERYDEDNNDDYEDESCEEEMVSPCLTIIKTPGSMFEHCCTDPLGIVNHANEGQPLEAKLAENEELIGILVMRVPLISRKLDSKKYLVTALTEESETNFYPRFPK